jgi:hypothetical protein
MSQNTELTQDELTTLKARADLLGVTYHPSIGLEKLREKVAAAQAGEPEVKPVAPAAVAEDPVEETLAQKRKRLKMDATALVRIRLTCMNPAKKDWDGELISTGNNLVPTMTKFIPFNADEGWHVPKMMYEQLRDRQCQVFVTAKTKNGVTFRQGKMIKEFAIEILPQLTPEELRDMAQRQAMAAGADV